MSQVMAIDFGTRRLGMAVSDADGRFALPLEALDVPPRARVAAVADAARERDVETIVIGRPRRAAGEDSHLWPDIVRFGDGLTRRGFQVVFEDEAFTTTEAQEMLAAAGSRPARGAVDAVAAKLILEQYLQRRHAEE